MSVFQRVIFDTAALGNHADPAVRARIWAESFEPVVTSMDVGFSPTDSRVIGQHNILVNDMVVVGEMFSSSFVGARTKNHINRDDEDHVYLSFNIGTTTQIGRQLGRETQVCPGQAAIAIMEAGIEALAPDGGHSISLKIPAPTFVQWRLSAPDLACRPIDCTRADYRVLTAYARILIENGSQLDAVSAASAARYLIDLTGHWLGASDKVRELESEDAVYHARLAAIRHAIAKQASDPRVRLQSIAHHLGIPTRTLQHILARAGESFSHMLTAARLRRGHILLLDPAHDDMPVSDIAFACGFLDVTSFYRTFRAAYDTTPNAFREQRRKMQR
jgi:AraC-like DNA-binding protein